MIGKRILATVLLIAGCLAGWFALSDRTPYVKGLDLAGGTHLTYKADTSGVEEREINDRMDALREVIEMRVNTFGVSEPIVQTETGSVDGETEHRLIVELPGVTDVESAVAQIGKTPVLEFMLMREATSTTATASSTASTTLDYTYIPTGLTGSLLSKAQIQFDQTAGQPAVLTTFDEQGTELLAQITRDNIGSPMAIFLDGNLLSAPIIRDEITDGNAVISGNFTNDEARELVRDLNFGALPLPVTLIETQTIGPALGADAWDRSIQALFWGLIFVSLYLIAWYRKNGVIASVALVVYAALVLTLFKLIPVTVTASGIAGFILSLGMAVDANVLIFERINEEIKRGKKPAEAREIGFSRAWPSIRDGNLTSAISAIILFYFSGAALVKGFALVYLIGIVVSMFTAIVVTRSFMRALSKA